MQSYSPTSKITNNSWITPPDVPDPDNVPIPLGWCLLVRPYPVKQDMNRSKIIRPDDTIDMMNYITNIGRVVSLGPCCFTRPEHRTKDGKQFDWVKPGDFISFPKNVGARRKFKGVSYVLLVDDEVVEKLPDPQVFDDQDYLIDIPEDHLVKYNTVKNPNYKGTEND